MARAKKTTRKRTSTRTTHRKTQGTYKKCHGKKCARKKTRAAYEIPKQFACDGQRGPATSAITRAGYGMPMGGGMPQGNGPMGGGMGPPMIGGMNRPMMGGGPMGPGRMQMGNNFPNRPGNAPSGPGMPSMRTTNANYGWNAHVVDDNKSSGLALGPQPFRTTKCYY